MKTIRATALGLMIAVAVSPALAGTETRSAEHEEQLRERLAEFKQRLDLTDEQSEQIRPIMEEATRSRQAVLDKFGIDLEGGTSPRLGPREARSLRNQINKVNKEMLSQLDGILTDDQLDELKRIQEEQRARIRERVRAGGRRWTRSP